MWLPSPPPATALLPLLPLCPLPAAVATALPAAALCYLCAVLVSIHIALAHRWMRGKEAARAAHRRRRWLWLFNVGATRAGNGIDNGWPRFNDNRAAPSEVYMKTKRRAAASHTTSTLRPLLPYTLEAVQVAEAFRCQSCSQPPHYDITYIWLDVGPAASTKRPPLPYTLEAVQVAEAFRLRLANPHVKQTRT